jgi:hypothetical protein
MELTPSRQEPEGKNHEKIATKASLLNDLYIDLLGSLVPGLFTVILGGAVVFLTLSIIYTALFGRDSTQSVSSTGVGNFLSGFHWEVATIIVVSSYIVGAIFFRQDPKRPDGMSAFRACGCTPLEPKGAAWPLRTPSWYRPEFNFDQTTRS